MYNMVNTLVENLGFDSIHKEDPIGDTELAQA
jgi:hypothetical protein